MIDIFYSSSVDCGYGTNLRMNLRSAAAIHKIASLSDADYILLVLNNSASLPTVEALRRMEQAMDSSLAPFLYCDYTIDGVIQRHAPYQFGSVRDDFDFGQMLFLRGDAFRKAAADMDADYRGAGLYDLRLRLTTDGSLPLYLREPLYEVAQQDGVDTHFDYVDPRNEQVQAEMQQAFTDHLKRIGAWLPPTRTRVQSLQPFPCEASVIIPVRNRVSTIADAIHSALDQEADFSFNVIVVDNHSSDGTSDVIESIVDDRLIHLIPQQRNLGIGGCWNLAMAHPLCGRYSVQLDSDDIYSSTATLQRIVDTFRAEGCGLVVGSYTLTDFNLNVIPPGLIAHREWTAENGHNNALRINGFGAPRAYLTELARQFPMPDVSYGEDYAMCLRLSRSFKVGRIYDSLYNCRRWDGNSDASPSREQLNRFNDYKDMVRTIELQARIIDAERFHRQQIAEWGEAAASFEGINTLLSRRIGDWVVQHNPERVRSTAAVVDKGAIAQRPCFLCADNRPAEQFPLQIGDYELLVNPFPIFPRHFTIACRTHTPQTPSGRISDLIGLASKLKGYTIFFNGADCGASAPDHMHFQAVAGMSLPIWDSMSAHGINRFGKVGCFFYSGSDAAQLASQVVETWGSVNILARCNEGVEEVIVIPRRAHRPRCYHDGSKLVSPAAIDIAGVMILPRKEDFESITFADIDDIMSQVCYSADELQPMVEVGILSADNPAEIEVEKHTDNTFTIRNVMIGKQFHWQRLEDQTFSGELELRPDSDGRVTAVNRLPVEDYLLSVISSEMSAGASLQFLAAHAIISRSWLLAQMSHKGRNYPGKCSITDDETVKWYDHDSHTSFDVCADDHCQRYQGIARITSPTVAEALALTSGMVLTYKGEICDARFSKCCGGVTEEFATCWQPVDVDYLRSFRDAAGLPMELNLSDEDDARRWIETSPEAFCNTDSAEILSTVLNSYDRETPDFYRWKVEYSADRLSEIIRSRTGKDFGKILSLTPLHRGPSGRIDRLNIVGTNATYIIGKELEIRRTLSETHLYSSAFVVDAVAHDVDGIPSHWLIRGAGWGHGVGLCQIGAAVMSANGYDYRQILNHYFPGTKLTKLY